MFLFEKRQRRAKIAVACRIQLDPEKTVIYHARSGVKSRRGKHCEMLYQAT